MNIQTRAVTTPESPTGQSQRLPKQELDAEAFLQLLVAQMRYQDPLNGMDQQQFMQQVATMSSMQQQFSINERLSTLVSSDQLSRATALIGREVSGVVGDQRIAGTVGSVSVVEGTPVLRIGDAALPFDSILTVE